ncbi:hypothetical protein [Amycolatopsis alba]|nr:hypothetical protein [Amycolatopsis alba]
MRKTLLAAMAVTFALSAPAVAFAEPAQTTAPEPTSASVMVPGYWVSAGFWNTEQDCTYQATVEFNRHPEYTDYLCRLENTGTSEYKWHLWMWVGDV